MTNYFERGARRRKAGALCSYIDGCALRLGCSPATGAAEIVRMLAGWTDAHWAEAARRAEVTVPSETTRRAVLDAYVARMARAA